MTIDGTYTPFFWPVGPYGRAGLSSPRTVATLSSYLDGGPYRPAAPAVIGDAAGPARPGATRPAPERPIDAGGLGPGAATTIDMGADGTIVSIVRGADGNVAGVLREPRHGEPSWEPVRSPRRVRELVEEGIIR